MADSLGVVATLKGRTIDIDPLQFTALTELLELNITLAAAETDTVVPLTGLTTPSVLIVWGDDGITFKVGAELVARNAYPLYVESTLNGADITSLKVSNADTVAHTVYILAAE
jgi:hypothetical protein